MDESQAVFEPLTLSDFKKSTFTASKTLNIYTITMTTNIYKIKIS